MERTCLKRGYGLMDGVIGEASGVRRLSDLLIASGFGRRLNFSIRGRRPPGLRLVSSFLISTMSSPTLSCSPMPASRDIEELSKRLEIARKRQEAERAARLRRQEEKERCKREEKEIGRAHV